LPQAMRGFDEKSEIDVDSGNCAVRRAGVYVVLGCNEMDPRPEVQTIYNSLIFFAPDGTVLGRHRKLMPTFVERTFWGQGMRVTSWSSTRISGGSAA
jgi:predicted amidohydrolase